MKRQPPSARPRGSHRKQRLRIVRGVGARLSERSGPNIVDSDARQVWPRRVRRDSRDEYRVNRYSRIASRAPDDRPSITAPSILVADADEESRGGYRQSSELCGCEIVEASDGADALAKAVARPPKLIVTALLLPVIDGYALCDILRRDPVTASVPILVVTSVKAPAEIDRAYRMGADAVLQKPVTLERFQAEARRLIADAQAMRGRAAEMRATAAAQREHSAHQRNRLSKSLARFTTTTPPAAPPPLVC